MWPIGGFLEEKIIYSGDFIYIVLFTRIISIWYSIFKYLIGPEWNYSLFWIYRIE